MHDLGRSPSTAAHSVTAYRLESGPQAGMTVVEINDVYQQVIARTVAREPGSREDVADLVLARSALERCADFTIEPFGRRKRVIALVTLRLSSRTLEALRADGAFDATA